MRGIKKFYPELTGLFVFITYLFTLAPSVMQIDSGELVTVQALAGIAHPTGYPLFTITGWIFLNLPLPGDTIFLANLLAAAWCAGGVIFIVKSATLLLRNAYTKTEKKVKKDKKKKPESVTEKTPLFGETGIILSSVAAGLMATYTRTFWLQGTSVEVYSLHIFLISLIVWSLLKAYYSGSTKDWYIFAAALALGFTNHMTTLLILPGAAVLYFSRNRFGKDSFILILKMLAVFIPILAVIYFYLPLRAAAGPALNWGDPVNFENFWRHFTGKQYRVWLFSSFDASKEQLEYFFNNIIPEIRFAGLVAVSAGLAVAFRYAKKAAWFLAVTIVFTVLYSINYDIHDIDSYFLLAYISAALAASFIFAMLFVRLKNIYLTGGLIFLVPVLIFALNYGEADKSGVRVFEDYTKAVLGSVEENSIIFSYQWDYFLAASYYYRYVEEYRPDVAVVDKELLRRSWYYPQLDTNYPWLLEGLDTEANNFLTAVQPFERDENFNARQIEAAYRAVMTGLVSENIGEHNFYVGPELVQNEMRRGEFSLPPGYILVPHLLMYKVVKQDAGYVPSPVPDFEIRYPAYSDRFTEFIKKTVWQMLTSRAIYEISFERYREADVYINKISSEYAEYGMHPKLEEYIKLREEIDFRGK